MIMKYINFGSNCNIKKIKVIDKLKFPIELDEEKIILEGYGGGYVIYSSCYYALFHRN